MDQVLNVGAYLLWAQRIWRCCSSRPSSVSLPDYRIRRHPSAVLSNGYPTSAARASSSGMTIAVAKESVCLRCSLPGRQDLWQKGRDPGQSRAGASSSARRRGLAFYSPGCCCLNLVGRDGGGLERSALLARMHYRCKRHSLCLPDSDVAPAKSAARNCVNPAKAEPWHGYRSTRIVDTAPFLCADDMIPVRRSRSRVASRSGSLSSFRFAASMPRPPCNSSAPGPLHS